MPSHCNSYGFSGGFAAICAAISWFLVQDRSCKINVTHLFSDTFMIVGIVLFVLSFFDFAGVLSEISLLFVAAVIGIFASGGMMLYATYMAFHMSCKSALNTVFDTASLLGSKNVFEAQDEVGISIMLLDLICALLLISAAISFSRTY